MSSSRTDFRLRKEQILAIAIDQYIKTVTPVGSKFIAMQYPYDISPATIRNILAELEDQGFLMHPHTSAGRIPTEKGYRYYVDNLMQEIQLLEEEKFRIKLEYERHKYELENLLDKVSNSLSEVTHYTSIISIDGCCDKIFCKGTSHVVGYPDYQDIEKIRNILRTLEQKEHLLKIINKDLIKKIEVYIGHEMALKEVDDCSLVVSKYETDTGETGRIAVLGPKRMNYTKVVSTLDYFSELINELL